MATPRVCDVDGCDKPSRSAGLCVMHYARLRRHGDVEATKHGEALRWLEDHADHQGDECLIYPFLINDKGYGYLRGPDGKTSLASRVICTFAHGAPPSPSSYACHSCHNGTGGCVHPKHLYWGDNRRNQMDRVEAGNSNRGSRHGGSKLSEAQVLEIRRRKKDGERAADLALDYQVAISTVYAVLNGGTWGWHA